VSITVQVPVIYLVSMKWLLLPPTRSVQAFEGLPAFQVFSLWSCAGVVTSHKSNHADYTSDIVASDLDS